MLINPNSGPGKALQIYKKQVAALYGEAELKHEVVVTERANHAFDLVRTLDLNLYAGCVIISGDGLLFEVRSCGWVWVWSGRVCGDWMREMWTGGERKKEKKNRYKFLLLYVSNLCVCVLFFLSNRL